MDIVAVNASYHKNGIITGLVTQAVNGMLSVVPDAKVTYYTLTELHVEFCNGCQECWKDDGTLKIGKCPLYAKDHLDSVLLHLQSCDRIIFATPIYALGPTALMKRFIERLAASLTPSKGFPRGRIPKRKDKKALIITSTVCPYPINMLLGFTRYSNKILRWLATVYGCSKSSKLCAGGMEKNEKTKTRFNKKAFDMGRELAG